MPKLPELFILRHGQTEWNLLKKYQGQRDSPLTALGVSQAGMQGEILLKHLAGRVLPAYASPLGRAARTAEIALLPLGQQARLDSRLKEVHFGAWEGKTHQEVFGPIDIDTSEQRIEHYFGSPGGENFNDMEQRCHGFLRELDGPSIIITHGITSRILRGIWLGLGLNEMLDLPIGQGCVYHLHAGAEHCLQAAPANATLPLK
ncbi:MAG: histidine phosphatase family protein [Rhodobacteraceae bacterium]|nr:histidine phosphatase family protein [Paracoccaceae bacterium]